MQKIFLRKILLSSLLFLVSVPALADKQVSPKPSSEQAAKSAPTNVPANTQPASEGTHFLSPGTELVAMLPGLLREVEFVTDSSRFLMYRSNPKEPFQIYTQQKGKLIEVKGAQVEKITKNILDWFLSIKIIKQLPAVEDPEDVYDWFDKGKGAYLLYRTFREDGYPQMLNVGNRTPKGEYYVSHVGAAPVYLIKGAVIDQMKSF